MLSDFLDFARLESGRVKLKMGPVRLEQIIADTVQIERPAAREREITIEVRSEPDLPLVYGDAGKLKQVLLNLVSNAIKYNRPGGSIVITIGREDQQVKVCVQDTGQGIPLDAMKHLFQRFYRVPDTEGYSRGTGLGLSIARRIVSEHGGRIWAQSEWEQGSSFCFTIPVEGTKPPSELGLDEDFEGAAPGGVFQSHRSLG
jgi:signal transduction histidine kinase